MREVENVTIKRNKIKRFTDNCLDIKPGGRKITFSNNVCEQQLKARRNRNHGTIVVRGLDNKVYSNKIENVFGGTAVFWVAGRGGNRVYNNTVKKVSRPTMQSGRANAAMAVKAHP